MVLFRHKLRSNRLRASERKTRLLIRALSTEPQD